MSLGGDDKEAFRHNKSTLPWAFPESEPSWFIFALLEGGHLCPPEAMCLRRRASDVGPGVGEQGDWKQQSQGRVQSQLWAGQGTVSSAGASLLPGRCFSPRKTGCGPSSTSTYSFSGGKRTGEENFFFRDSCPLSKTSSDLFPRLRKELVSLIRPLQVAQTR